MTTTYTEGKRLSDILKWETDMRFCRQKVTLKQDLAAAAALDIGTVLQADSTKKVKCTAGASADSILLEKVEAADLVAGDVVAVALVRGPAIVDKNQLGIAAAQLATAVTALEALEILARVEPTYTEG